VWKQKQNLQRKYQKEIKLEGVSSL
jgi:hypothetical protein